MKDLTERKTVYLDDAVEAIVGCTNCGTEDELRAYAARHSLENLWTGGIVDALDAIKRLPSAQPEIIRKPVVGYEGCYEVDTCGRIYSLDRVIHVEDNGRTYDKPLKGGIMKQRLHSQGYKIVSLTKNGKTKNVFVHRIVAMAFLPNPDNLPCINHKDEDKTNNFIENLEWCTYQYNNAYGSKPRKHSKWMTGRKLSDEHKKAISDALKDHYKNHESHMKGSVSPHRKPVIGTDICGMEFSFESVSDAARYVGDKDGKHISSVCNGRRKKHKGYEWKWAERREDG